MDPPDRQVGAEPKVQYKKQDDKAGIADTMFKENVSTNDETTKCVVEHRFPLRNRKAAFRIRIDALVWPRDDDERTAKEAIHGEDSEMWQSAIGAEVDAFRQLKCWEEV